jgi:hypothetical protein
MGSDTRQDNGAFHFELTGWDKLETDLKELRVKVCDDLASAIVPAGELVASAIVEQAPHESGFMREHLDVKVSPWGNRGEEQASVFIGPNGRAVYPKGEEGGEGGGGDPAVKVANAIEFGHKVRNKPPSISAKTGKKRKQRKLGQVAANPFITRGFEMAKGSALASIYDGLKKLITKYAPSATVRF